LVGLCWGRIWDCMEVGWGVLGGGFWGLLGFCKGVWGSRGFGVRVWDCMGLALGRIGFGPACLER
jgi:hypothetical protein